MHLKITSQILEQMAKKKKNRLPGLSSRKQILNDPYLHSVYIVRAFIVIWGVYLQNPMNSIELDQSCINVFPLN